MATLCLSFLARFFPALILSAMTVSIVISSLICSSGMSSINSEGLLWLPGEKGKEQDSNIGCIKYDIRVKNEAL